MQLHLFVFNCFEFTSGDHAVDFLPVVLLLQVSLDVVPVSAGETAARFGTLGLDVQALDLWL